MFRWMLLRLLRSFGGGGAPVTPGGTVCGEFGLSDPVEGSFTLTNTVGGTFALTDPVAGIFALESC